MSAVGRTYDAPFSGLPGKAKFGGYLYILLFANDMIKVGCSSNPTARIGHHRQGSESFGIEVDRLWLSPHHDEHLATERVLIGRVEMLGGEQIRKEYFKGVDFARVVRLAQQIPYPPVDVAAHEARLAGKPPLFGPLQEIDDALNRPRTYDLQTIIGALFGRQRDGAYELPSPERSSETVPLDLVYEIADITGEDVEDILELDWPGLMRRMLRATVDCQASELRLYLYRVGRLDLLRPLGDNVEPGCP